MDITQHLQAIDNYQNPAKWADHPQAAERIAYHQAQIDLHREKNRQSVARRRARQAGTTTGEQRAKKTRDRAERLRDRIARKQAALRYYEQNRDTNPEYYDRQIGLALLDIEMATGSLEALSAEPDTA